MCCSVAVAGAVWLNILPDALANNLPAASANLASKICKSIFLLMRRSFRG